jgi:hypothetical protein
MQLVVGRRTPQHRSMPISRLRRFKFGKDFSSEISRRFVPWNHLRGKLEPQVLPSRRASTLCTQEHTSGGTKDARDWDVVANFVGVVHRQRCSFGNVIRAPFARYTCCQRKSQSLMCIKSRDVTVGKSATRESPSRGNAHAVLASSLHVDPAGRRNRESP